MRFLLLVLLFASDKVFSSEREEEENLFENSENDDDISFKSSRSPFSSPHLPFPIDLDDDQDEEETEILVFEDSSKSRDTTEIQGPQFKDNVQGLGVEEDIHGLGPDEETLGAGFESDSEETVKTKRNSLSGQQRNLQKGVGHSSLPKAAALQSSSQGIAVGGFTPHNRGQLFQSFQFPRDSSCGMCSRDRNLCQIISGIFTRSPLPYGYSLVTPIPAGVCNISIVEVKPSKNFFALRRKDGTYALNGNWKIEAAGNYGISGSLFSYSPSDGKRGEKLQTLGPLLEPIDLMIIYQSPNPGIKYEYRVPVHDFIGQQSPARILPVQPNHGGRISNTYNIDASLQSQSNFQSVVGGIQGQSGSTILSARTPFSGNDRGTASSSIFSQRSNALDNTQSVGTANKWNLPPFHPGANRIPLNSGSIQNAGLQAVHFGQGNGAHYPSQQSASPGSQFTNGRGTRILDSRFKTERFPGVLNTDPRTQPRVSFPEETKHEIHPSDSFKVHSDRNSPSVIKQTVISYTPRSTSIGLRGSVPVKKSKHLHRTRHNHGSRDILPGPAVGGNGLPPITPEYQKTFPAVIQSRIPLKNTNAEETAIFPRDRKRRRRKKGKRKNSKKQRNRFQWVFKGLTSCTKECGGGNQSSVFSCERRRKNKVVADRFCDGIPKTEAKTISCNLKPCPAKWVPGDWSSCSVTCGFGIQTRSLHCKQEVSQSLTLMVPEGACLAPKEGNTTQVCKMEDCPTKEPKWRAKEWGPCSAECGIGTRERPVNCIILGKIVDDVECSKVDYKPSGKESCDMGSCATNTWFFSQWSDECSNMCGEGVYTRTVTCIMEKEASTTSCPALLRPNTTRPCSKKTGCGGQWFTGPWSECSVSCGTGRETRTVKCLDSKYDSWKIVSDLNCLADLKPSRSRECILQPCQPEWFTSEWKECFEPCGESFQEREVKCLDVSMNTSPNCPNTTKPVTRQPCIQDKCRDSEKNDKGNSHVKSQTVTEENSTSQTNKILRESDTQNEYEKSSEITPSEEKSDPIENINNLHDNNQRKNELEVVHATGQAVNVIPDKDAQGDESVADDDVEEDEKDEEKKSDDEKSKKLYKDEKEVTKKRPITEKSTTSNIESTNLSCIDRIKNCHLVFRARLCRLKYYNKLCCLTCQGISR